MESRIQIGGGRRVIIDRKRLLAFKDSPESGPKILFFSGGSALRKLSRTIIHYSHNTIHLITSLDSGGSSREIRKAFKMFAIGDLRNRILSLADSSLAGNPEVYRLFNRRLKSEDNLVNLEELNNIIAGEHPRIAVIERRLRVIIVSYLKEFMEKRPQNFDFRNGSIGNLIIAGGFLKHNRDIDLVLFIFSSLLKVRGVVRPILAQDIHLIAELEDGSTIIGQHCITGKVKNPINSSVKKVYISNSLTSPQEMEELVISQGCSVLIKKANLICYPMGSFYSSIIVNLLPKGVSKAIAENSCLKVYIPNTTEDSEVIGKNVIDCVQELLKYLLRFSPDEQVGNLLNYVIVDSKGVDYPGNPDFTLLKDIGVAIIDVELVTSSSAPLIDAHKLEELLLSLSSSKNDSFTS